MHTQDMKVQSMYQLLTHSHVKYNIGIPEMRRFFKMDYSFVQVLLICHPYLRIHFRRERLNDGRIMIDMRFCYI